MYEYLQKNIESDCVSPKGNYRVKGYNTLYSYPYTKYDFWKSGEFNGYTPVYMYLGPNECKYYLYNPDGEVIAESDRKIYYIVSEFLVRLKYLLIHMQNLHLTDM